MTTVKAALIDGNVVALEDIKKDEEIWVGVSGCFIIGGAESMGVAPASPPVVEEEKSCDTCKHRDLPRDREPCRDCLIKRLNLCETAESNWEKCRDRDPGSDCVDHCDTCEHRDNLRVTPPCRSCLVRHRGMVYNSVSEWEKADIDPDVRELLGTDDEHEIHNLCLELSDKLLQNKETSFTAHAVAGYMAARKEMMRRLDEAHAIGFRAGSMDEKRRSKDGK